MTQHQMVNIGIGNEPNAPLKYAAEIRLTDYIAPFKAYCFATSEEDARRIFNSATFYSNEVRSTDRARTLHFAVENIRLC